MVPYLVFVLWLYRVFFSKPDIVGLAHFLRTVPEPLLGIYALCSAVLLVLFPLLALNFFGFWRPSQKVQSAIFITLALLLFPIMLINFCYGQGFARIAPLLFYSGLLCNCFAVVMNGGKMPIAKEAIEKSIGKEVNENLSDEELFEDVRHSLVRGPVRVPFLIDRFHHKLVMRKGVWSIGDALLTTGIIIELLPKF